MPDGMVAARWRLDPAHSTAEFRVPSFWGLIKVKGHFDRLEGWLEMGDGGRRRLELTIDATSLTTGNDKRDEHLRSADFFDTEHHPTVRFVSTSVSDRYKVASRCRASCWRRAGACARDRADASATLRPAPGRRQHHA